MEEMMEVYSYRDLSKKLAERDRQLADAQAAFQEQVKHTDFVRSEYQARCAKLEASLTKLQDCAIADAEHMSHLRADLAQAETDRDNARALIAKLRQAQYEFTHKLEQDIAEWRNGSTALEAKEGK